MKILILTVPIGAGHIKAAQAIKQAIEKLAPNAQVRFENCFNWVNPLYGLVYTKIYNFAQLKARNLLNLLYGGLGIKKGSAKFLYRGHNALKYHFGDLLAEFKPDYVLATHFSTGYFSALYKKRYNYKLGIVVTDYYIHPHWVNKEIDHYFIPHKDLTEQIVGYGVDRKKVLPFGIPVSLELEGKIDTNSARRRFGLSKNRTSVVVMGSRVFGGEWFEIVREIIDFDYDLLVLCGENKQVMEKIKGLKAKANLTTLGMVERIYELIGVCDILITKAGGITTTEATKAGPCLLFANSIPGLEDKNEDFFIRHHAGIKITKDNAKMVIADLLRHPEKISQTRQNLKRLNNKDSAINIAKMILGSNLYGKNRV